MHQAGFPIVEAIAPSNIALLKYWGKHPNVSQWPTNPSISLTLNHLHTCTRASLSTQEDHQLCLNEQVCTRKDKNAIKVFAHLDRIAALLGSTYKLTITTHNSFPTACGIASSASGFAALTLAALAAYGQGCSLEELEANGWSRSRIADLARLGSGSACRSLWGGVVQWSPGPAADAQEYGPLYDHTYWPLGDTVVLVSKQAKHTSSSEAHEHAWTSPLFAPRLAGFAEKVVHCHVALAERSMEKLGPLIEQEAMEMHAVMMTATPSTYFFGEETAKLLCWLRQLRQREGLQVYFTLDAGPNVHIIGEHSQQQRLHYFLAKEQENYSFVYDVGGAGPRLGAYVEQESVQG